MFRLRLRGLAPALGSEQETLAHQFLQATGFLGSDSPRLAERQRAVVDAVRSVVLPLEDIVAARIARIRALGQVDEERYEGDIVHLKARIPEHAREEFSRFTR